MLRGARAAARRRCRGTPHRRSGGAASALISTLMPSPSTNASFGQMLSTTTTPGCWPSRTAACTRTEPRWLPSRTRSPASMPEPCGIVGMEQRGRTPFLAPRGRHLGEARVQVMARRRRHEAERVLVAHLVDDREVVGQLRHARMVGPELLPVRLELEAARRRREAVQVVRGLVVGQRIPAARLVDRLRIRPAGAAQDVVDQLPLGHAEARMRRAPRREASAQITKWLVRHSA